MATKMIAILSFALLLGAPAVQGTVDACFAAKMRLELWPGKMYYEDAAAVEHKHFDQAVDIAHVVASLPTSFGQESDLFTLKCRGDCEHAPSVTVDAVTYKLLSLNIISTDADEWTAGLQVTFVNSETKWDTKYVSFFVPLLGNRNAEQTSACLNKELLAVAKLSKHNSQSATSLRWLDPLLNRAFETKKVYPPGRKCKTNHRLFLTDCQHVQIDALRPFLRSTRDEVNPAFFYPRGSTPLQFVLSLRF